MAKITISGQNHLQNLDDDWGGVNESGSTETHYETNIPNGSEWGMNRGEVERFIKAQFRTKVGYIHIDSGFVYAFDDESKFRQWQDTPDDSLLVCPKVALPAGDTAGDALSVYSIDTNQYYSSGAENIILKFKVRNIVDGEESTDIAVTITKNGASIYYQSRPVADSEGFYTVVLAGSLFRNVANVSEPITLTVSRTGEDRSINRILNIRCIDMQLALHSEYNFGAVNPSTIWYVPTFTLPSGVTNIKLVMNVYYIDDTQVMHVETSNITTNNKVEVPLTWESSHLSGVYRVEAYLDMGGGQILSKVVKTNVMRVKSDDEDEVTLVAIEPIDEVTLYDDITPRIAVFYKGNDSANVRIELNEGTPTNIVVPCGYVYSSFSIPIEEENNTLSAQVVENNETIGGSSIHFTASGTFNWRIISGFVHNLVAKGRSNQEVPTPATWGGIASFFNFTWDNYGSCWKDNALHMTGGSSVTLDMSPFYSTTAYNETRRIGGGILDTGRTFRIRFKVSNVSDSTKKIIECWDENVGFYCTADTIFVKMGNSGEITTDPVTGAQATQNNRHFSADEEIELCITVQPYWDANRNLTQHFVTMYVNGQFAGEAILGNTTLSQSSALPVSLHADGCDLDVYQITYYEKCLDSFEVLQNSVMALGSLSRMRDEFDKNQCYTGNGTVNFNETFKYCKWLSAKAGDTIEGTCNIIVNTHEFNPAISSTDEYPLGQQELELFFFRNGEVDTTRSVKYVGLEDGALRVRIQGTSTASEFRKNMRYDGKKNLKKYRWSSDLYENGGSINPSDGWYEVDATQEDALESKKKMYIYLRGTRATENPCTLLTVKTNYNESTSLRNLPMARWVDDAMRHLSTVRDGGGNLLFPNILTPPQRNDVKTRQAIDGLPAVQFTHTVGSQDYRFTGKVDLITDKKNSSVFGFASNSRDYSIEFRNGNTDICNFRCPYLGTAGKYMDSSFVTRGEDCLEYRWPDLDVGDVYYGDGYVGQNSALQRLFDFVFNCHPDFIGYKSKNGVISSTNHTITILGQTRDDNAVYRRQKFYAEMGNYLVKDSITFNAFVTKVLLWTDQRAKNQFFTHFTGDEVVSTYSDDLNTQGQTYEILRLLPYDIDTSLRGDNASRLRYDFTRLYSDADVFNDGVSVTTVSETFYPTQAAISDPTSFIANRVMGKRSALFELLDATCQQEYAAFFAYLSTGYLNVDALRRYCITDEADAFNSVIYNADTQYKYVASGSTSDQLKAHGSAKEDLMWWADGRMYFMGGENSAGDFTSTSIRATMCMDSVLDETNRRMRIPEGASGITLRIKSRFRNYIATRLGSTGQMQKQYAETPHTFYDVTLVTNGISNEDSGRFNIFGQKFFEDIEDLSHLYISSISTWSGFAGMKTMKFGSGETGFYNPALTNIKGTENLVFGNCETVDLRNCTVYADSDFRCFPVLKTLLLTGCDALTELRLPTSDVLQTLALPSNITKLEIKNKTNLSSITIQNGGSVGSIYAENISTTVEDAILALLNVIVPS